MNSFWLIIAAVLAIALLLFLIIKRDMQAFLALTIVSLLLGLAAGLSPTEIIEAFDVGMGETVAFIAMVVGLGSMFGEILSVSGGAESLAVTMLDKLGEDRAPWALAAAGFLISIPIFLDVAFVILIPILYSLAKKSKKSLLFYTIPLLAGLLTTHALVPPTPGPTAAASIMGADLGWVILFGVIVGIPATIAAGPFFGKFISDKIFVEVPDTADLKEEFSNNKKEKDLPSFGSAVFVILLPLILILMESIAPLMFGEGTMLTNIFVFIGHPYVALTITTIFTILIFGYRRGFDKKQINEITTKSLEPAGIIILITGAGGVFGEVLIATGITDVLTGLMQQANIPLILFAYITAVLLRLSVGSVTVALVTTASIVAPIAANVGFSTPMLALLVIVIGSGAVIFPHVNDSGFWLITRYSGTDITTQFKSWSIVGLIISVVGFIGSIIISFFL